MERRRVWLMAAIPAMVFALMASLCHAKEKDGKKEKVAVVNGTAITQSELDNELNRYERQITMNGRSLDADQRVELKKKVLEGLIDRELLIQQSKKLGIKVSDTEVNDQIAAVKKRYPNEQEFAKTLSSMNLTEAALKTQFAQDMTIKKMIEQEVTSKVSITDEDSKAFYDSHPDLFKTQPMVRASHILAKVDAKAPDADKAKAKDKILEAQKRLKKGDDFATVAKEMSDCPSSSKGGDLDFFQKGQMVGPFEDAAFALKQGAVSDVVETQFGYHLIKVTDKKDAGTMAYPDIKDRIAQHLRQEKIDQMLSQYMEQLRSKAKIETFNK